MSNQGTDILKQFSPRRIIWPILIGLGVVAYLIYREFDPNVFRSINWGGKVVLGFAGGIFCMLIRDLAYIYRLRVLTDYQLNWNRSLIVIMIWEFASAITPSIVGGTAVALFVLTKEGIKAGRSTAIVFLSAYLDEVFFILLAPIVFFVVGIDNVFLSVRPGVSLEAVTSGAFLGVFWVGYGIIFIYTALLHYGLLINPKKFRDLIVWLFSTRLLRRWKEFGQKTGEEMVIASAEFKGKPASFWVKSFSATFASWTGRYLVVNCLIWAFYSADSLGLYNHFVIYARQIIMWVVLLISPTPGGSGLAEGLFQEMLVDFTPTGFSASMAFFWRLLSYFPYLIIGAIVFPRWYKKISSKLKTNV